MVNGGLEPLIIQTTETKITLSILELRAHNLCMAGLRTERLVEFTNWVAKHVTGDEKGEAQIFLDRLFIAFGQKGIKEAGATLEMRVKKSSQGGTAFADLVWKPVVLIEMKKRGEDLSRHYRQAFDYWTRLAPGRPRYVILCNFDEFWIYDFETQMDTPVDQVQTKELQNNWGPLAFLFRTPEKPVFGNHQEEITREAADRLAACFKKLIARKVEHALAQRFILQMLVALFAQNIGLLEKYFVIRLLDECKEPKDCFDLLGGLFVEMNTPGITPGGRYRGVEYFNGGLFAQPARLELYTDEINQLKKAADANWSKVRPEIFGTLFEHSIGEIERHAFGAHFTHPTDIMKIVGPTIVEPWRERIDNAKTLPALQKLHERLQHFTVLDPACGSGNFLYIAYRELKRLEARLLERLQLFSKKSAPTQKFLGFVTARQFYGIDRNPFAVELAKVTMMIARKLAIDELHVTEAALPLDNLDANFIAGDALIDPNGNPVSWPKVDVIIGNPPFLGAKRFKPERGVDYVTAVRKAYPDVPGMADYCVFWFRKAHDHLPPCTTIDPFTGRAGLVGTQNIRNNQSRVGGLDHVVASGTIIEAVDNQPWSGEANVHVSIVNWLKSQESAVVPQKRRLWSQSDPKATRKRQETNGSLKGMGFDLTFRDVRHINSSLSDDTDVSCKKRLTCALKPKKCFQGKIPGYEGFLVDAANAAKLRKDSAEVIVPYLTGRELLDEFRIERWAIDFGSRDMVQAASFPSAFEHCKTHVLSAVRATYEQAVAEKSDMAPARKEHLNRWWQFWNRRDELSFVLRAMQRYIGCSRVTRRPVMVFLSANICPSDLVQVFAFDDDYSYGVLQSKLHFEWFRKSSRLKVESDTRYSVREVFETFPWPQNPAIEQVHVIAAAGRKLRAVRQTCLREIGGGLRDLYRMLDLPGKNPLRDAQIYLDEAVFQAYGLNEGREPLEFLLELNHSVHEAEITGRAVERPGLPSFIGDRSEFVSEDCFEA